MPPLPRRSLTLRALCALALIGLYACSRQSPARPVYPQPTEDWLDEEAEERQTPLRKAWFEHRHQAAPGVDWRELERQNGEAQVEKRNRLATGLSTASPWFERGSDNQAGRVHVAVPSPDGTSLYVGTALGGLWRGSYGGAGWTPLGDNLPGGVHQLAVLPGAAPGAPDVLLAANGSGSVHVTHDLGATWQVPSGLTVQNGLRRVLSSSDGSQTVFVLRRRNGNWRLMRSTDALASFQSVLDFGTFPGDAWIRRDGGVDLYAMTSGGVQRSSDLGTSWTSLGPAPTSGSQAELTGSEAGAPRLWSVITSGSQKKLYRSNDAGASWTFLSNLSDYWDRLAGSIVSPDTLLYGGVEAHRSNDGGSSFSVINTWGAYYGSPATKLHADIQGIDVFPDANTLSGENWYIATDGGLYRSFDLLGSVINLSLSGLRISQYYSTHTSSAVPDHVVAGAQDQGYQRASTAPVAPETVLDFAQLISGDYGHLTSGDGDHDFLFCDYPGFVLIQIGENNPSLATEDFPPGEDHAWIPPLTAASLDPRDFFLCASHLYRYDKSAGNNWNFSQWSAFDFGVSPGEYLGALAFSPLDPQRAYAVTDRGRLYHSGDRGVSWTASTSSAPGGQYFYGTALLASSLDVNTVYVGGSGYSGPAVLRSTDGGLSFQAWSDGLPPTLVYCLGEAPDGSGSIFCGTETAAYRRDPGSATWTDITSNQAPITTYWSVEALSHENTMRFGTYGRGIWDYRIDPQATASVRNGSGLNPLCLASVSPPVLGGTWAMRVDASVLPTATSAFLVVRTSPASGPVLPYGELLVTGPKLLSLARPVVAGQVDFALPVPSSTHLVGLQASAQALLQGGAAWLCNALDVALGY